MNFSVIIKQEIKQSTNQILIAQIFTQYIQVIKKAGET